MTETPDRPAGAPGPDAEALQSAWEETLSDMEAMAEARQADGWRPIAFPAGDTAPENREVGETDRFGMTFVVPDAVANDFEEAFRRGTFPKYEVYRKELEGRVFLVVELLDPETETTILAAGQYELRNAAGLVADAETAGEMFSHFQTLDGTHLGTFRHDSHEKFVPHADRIDEFVAGEATPSENWEETGADGDGGGSGGGESEGAESEGGESDGDGSDGAESDGDGSDGAESDGNGSDGAE